MLWCQDSCQQRICQRCLGNSLHSSWMSLALEIISVAADKEPPSRLPEYYGRHWKRCWYPMTGIPPYLFIDPDVRLQFRTAICPVHQQERLNTVPPPLAHNFKPHCLTSRGNISSRFDGQHQIQVDECRFTQSRRHREMLRGLSIPSWGYVR
jgi:hypothetical protein